MAKSRNNPRGFFPVCAHWWWKKSWSCISQNLPCSPAHCATSAAYREYWWPGKGKSRKRHRTRPVAISCSRITGIWTVPNWAQNGHSKSEYSVTSTRAVSLPRVKPRNPSVAATGVGEPAGAVPAGRCASYHRATPLPIATTPNR